MSDEVRLGLYGCNPYRTAQLMAATRACGPMRVSVTACFDIDRVKADRAAATYGGRAVYDLTSFQKADFDVAVVCLPPHLHARAFAACAEAGKAIYLEKPVCVDEAGKATLIEAMTRYRPICYVGLSSPYLFPHRKALEIRRRPGYGRLIACHHHRFHPSTGQAPKEPNWRHFLDQSGGELNQHCCHDMHFLRLVCGEPESVTAVSYTSPDYQPAHEEEELAACFRMPEGLAVFSMSQRSHRAHLNGQIHLENAAIVYDWAPHSRVQVFRDRPRAPDEVYEWDAYGAIPPDEDPDVLQMRDFLDAYCNGRPMPITLADGIQAYEMTAAIRQSYRTGQPVTIPSPLALP